MPRTLVPRVAVGLALLLALLNAATPSSAATPVRGYAPVGTAQLLTLVNDHRRSLGLRALTSDPVLAARARDWSGRMAASGRLSHDEDLFTGPHRAALRMRTLGENVGWNVSVTAQHRAFLASSGHRRNVETPGFTRAGFAVVRGADGRLWTTQVFGVPR